MDVSRWQAGPYPGNYNAIAHNAMDEVDFVIVKATEGDSKVDECFKEHYQRAKSLGKLLGAYHYANGKNPTAEARWFWANVKAHNGEFVPCLDWEGARNASFGDKSWCLDFATEYHRLSGIYPMVYVSASVIPQVASCHPKCALWVAGYPDDRASFDPPRFPYSIKPWREYAVWQFSSGGGLDRDVSPLTREGWLSMCGGWDVTATEQEAKDVIRRAICGK